MATNKIQENEPQMFGVTRMPSFEGSERFDFSLYISKKSFETCIIFAVDVAIKKNGIDTHGDTSSVEYWSDGYAILPVSI